MIDKSKIIKRALIICLCTLFTCQGCSQLDGDQGLLTRITEKGELVVLTTNQPTTYYIDREGNPTGPEYDMTHSFAKYLGVEPRYVMLDSTDAAIEALRKGEGDIAAAGLTITGDRVAEFDFGPAYIDVSEYLVCHRDAKFIDSIEDLKGIEIVVPTSTSYIDTLYKEYPGIFLIQ